jgi:hypothetical protein
MPTKEEEYSHIPIKKIDVVPMLKEFSSGVIKGNTSDLLGLPVDILDSVSNILSKNSTSPPSKGSSAWFRELVGATVEDSSIAETAGTMVSVPGLEKAMILPFIKMGKKMNRTQDQQKYVEESIKKLAADGRTSPEIIYNLAKGYAEKNRSGQMTVKGVISDVKASIDKDTLESITDVKMKDYIDAVKRGDKNAPALLDNWIGDLENNKERTTTLGKLLNYSELYEYYPELKDIPVRALSAYSHNIGEINTKAGKIQNIGLNTARYGDQTLNTLLHEIQHAIQGKEGWKPGGNSGQFTRSKVEKALENKRQEVKGTDNEKPIIDLQENLRKIYYKQYKKLAGEQEARFTQDAQQKDQKQVENLILDLLQKGKTPSNYME